MRPVGPHSRWIRAVGLLTLLPSLAEASGLDAPCVGALTSGPLTADPAALFHNPARLSGLTRHTLSLGLGLVAGRASVTRRRLGAYQNEDTLNFAGPIPAEDLDVSKTGSAPEVTATPVSPTGDLFAALLTPRRGLVLGLGVYAPYAAIVDYPDDGAQRFAIQDANIVVAHLSGGLALQVNPELSVGLAVSYVQGQASMKKRQDFGALPDFGRGLSRPPISQVNDFGADAPTMVRELNVLERPISIHDATARAVTFNAGVHVAPNRDWDFALTYQNGAALDFEGDFTLDLDDDFFTGDLEHVGLRYAPFVQGDATVAFQLPKRLAVAAGRSLSPRYRLEGRLGYVRWSELQTFRIELESAALAQPRLGLPPRSSLSLPRAWNDTISVAVLGQAQGPESVTFAALLGYDSPASPDSTVDAASPDGHRLTFGAGLIFAASPDLSVSADARLQSILPRTVTTSDYDLGNGEYTLLVASILAHVEVRL